MNRLTYEELAQQMIANADSHERAAYMWIQSNPHTSLIYALAAHESSWHGCDCNLQEIVNQNNKAIRDAQTIVMGGIKQ